ncbi:MAG: 2Fe-2S iron-sulfur cluster binding domain-containing protein [Hahellaceae bacterium]|nr:2Fe-2S iron-sulfur cluster binding domain-containing protein [Hahellaceae bacterium]
MLSNAMNRWLPGLMARVGRDRLEYFFSNTLNTFTPRLSSFFWTYDCKARILDMRQETEDTRTFTLLPNQHFQNPVPGQHVEIRVRNPRSGEVLARNYTISAAGEMTIEITVKHKAGGDMSTWLHQHAAVGDEVELSQPRGRFVYQHQPKLLFVCAGSGVTPCFAIAEALLGQTNPADLAFFYRSRSPANTIFHDKLIALKSRLALTFSFSDDEAPAVLEKGMLAQIETAYPDFMDRHIYLCGPEGFRDALLEDLKARNFDLAHLTLENFTPTQAPVAPGESVEGTVTVRLTARNLSFEMNEAHQGMSLLEAAEANGIEMEHGCRTGMCGTCRTHLLEGEVAGNQIGNCIYPCTTYPRSQEIVLE